MAKTFTHNELEHRVAELEKRVQELQSEVVKYQNFFNSSIDAIFLTNPNGQIYQANPAACELFQMTEAEFIDEGRFAIYANDDEDINKALDERESRGHYRGILKHKKKDGSVFPAEVSSVLYTDHKGERKTCTIIRDMSAVQQQKEESERFFSKYQTLFQFFPYGITVSDSKGKIIETNAAAEKLLGLNRAKHEQRSIYGKEWRIIRTDGSDMPSEEWAGVIALKENRVVSNVEMGFVWADNGKRSPG